MPLRRGPMAFKVQGPATPFYKRDLLEALVEARTLAQRGRWPEGVTPISTVTERATGRTWQVGPDADVLAMDEAARPEYAARLRREVSRG